MWSRVLVAMLVACAAAPAAAGAQESNQWLERRVINMTHQGGEDEHPSGTMYALRESLALGADSLELDVQPTEDGVLVVQHDQSVERTTGVDRSIYDMTLDEVRELDAAHNFVPGKGTVRGLAAGEYPLRGVRTGEKAPPLGYTPDDFGIVTLEEVFEAFPDVPMNVELKGRADDDRDSFLRNADLLVALLRSGPHPPVIVVSFDPGAVDRFHTAMPEIDVAPGIGGVATFFAANVAPAGTKALQVPPAFSGLTIMTPDFVDRAHRAGLAVHVWFSGQEESERVYNRMLDMGADGLMPAKPRALERVLCQRETPRPVGNPNHCFRGTEQAAKTCAPRVVALGRVAADGTSRVRVTRAEDRLDYACTGSVRLRSGKSRLGSGGLHFPYGIREVTVTARLGSKSRVRLRRAKRLMVAAATRVEGQTRERARRLALRGSCRESEVRAHAQAAPLQCARTSDSGH